MPATTSFTTSRFQTVLHVRLDTIDSRTSYCPTYKTSCGSSDNTWNSPAIPEIPPAIKPA
ncbi:hypothetical protein Entas_1485 [Enterobacter soli]|nr:hypothetical protein Entas_1485 [Enterobacter soli]